MGPSKLIKIITLTVQATENHNQIKVNNILRWLKSGHDVKVNITGRSDRQKQMESICQKIEKETRPGSKLLQKVIKADSIKFTLQANENSANLVIDDAHNASASADDGLDSIVAGKDILSEEFEQELSKSIRGDTDRMKKKK